MNLSPETSEENEENAVTLGSVNVRRSMRISNKKPVNYADVVLLNNKKKRKSIDVIERQESKKKRQKFEKSLFLPNNKKRQDVFKFFTKKSTTSNKTKDGQNKNSLIPKKIIKQGTPKKVIRHSNLSLNKIPMKRTHQSIPAKAIENLTIDTDSEKATEEMSYPTYVSYLTKGNKLKLIQNKKAAQNFLSHTSTSIEEFSLSSKPLESDSKECLESVVFTEVPSELVQVDNIAANVVSNSSKSMEFLIQSSASNASNHFSSDNLEAHHLELSSSNGNISTSLVQVETSGVMQPQSLSIIVSNERIPIQFSASSSQLMVETANQNAPTKSDELIVTTSSPENIHIQNIIPTIVFHPEPNNCTPVSNSQGIIGDPEARQSCANNDESSSETDTQCLKRYLDEIAQRRQASKQENHATKSLAERRIQIEKEAFDKVPERIKNVEPSNTSTCPPTSTDSESSSRQAEKQTSSSTEPNLDAHSGLNNMPRDKEHQEPSSSSQDLTEHPQTPTSTNQNCSPQQNATPPIHAPEQSIPKPKTYKRSTNPAKAKQSKTTEAPQPEKTSNQCTTSNCNSDSFNNPVQSMYSSASGVPSDQQYHSSHNLLNFPNVYGYPAPSIQVENSLPSCSFQRSQQDLLQSLHHSSAHQTAARPDNNPFSFDPSSFSTPSMPSNQISRDAIHQEHTCIQHMPTPPEYPCQNSIHPKPRDHQGRTHNSSNNNSSSYWFNQRQPQSDSSNQNPWGMHKSSVEHANRDSNNQQTFWEPTHPSNEFPTHNLNCPTFQNPHYGQAKPSTEHRGWQQHKPPHACPPQMSNNWNNHQPFFGRQRQPTECPAYNAHHRNPIWGPPNPPHRSQNYPQPSLEGNIIDPNKWLDDRLHQAMRIPENNYMLSWHTQPQEPTRAVQNGFADKDSWIRARTRVQQMPKPYDLTQQIAKPYDLQLYNKHKKATTDLLLKLANQLTDKILHIQELDEEVTGQTQHVMMLEPPSSHVFHGRVRSSARPSMAPQPRPEPQRTSWNDCSNHLNSREIHGHVGYPRGNIFLENPMRTEGRQATQQVFPNQIYAVESTTGGNPNSSFDVRSFRPTSSQQAQPHQHGTNDSWKDQCLYFKLH